jgi:hypothetical protein
MHIPPSVTLAGEIRPKAFGESAHDTRLRKVQTQRQFAALVQEYEEAIGPSVSSRT